MEWQIRELAPTEIERVGAVLGLSRLGQGDGYYLVAWEDEEPVGHAQLQMPFLDLRAARFQLDFHGIDGFTQSTVLSRSLGQAIAHLFADRGAFARPAGAGVLPQ